MTPQMEAALLKVIRAIREEGPNPRVHREMWLQLQRSWPTLGEALSKLLQEANREGHWSPAFYHVRHPDWRPSAVPLVAGLIAFAILFALLF